MSSLDDQIKSYNDLLFGDFSVKRPSKTLQYYDGLVKTNKKLIVQNPENKQKYIDNILNAYKKEFNVEIFEEEIVEYPKYAVILEEENRVKELQSKLAEKHAILASKRGGSVYIPAAIVGGMVESGCGQWGLAAMLAIAFIVLIIIILLYILVIKDESDGGENFKVDPHPFKDEKPRTSEKLHRKSERRI
jgi:hypothetical protein